MNHKTECIILRKIPFREKSLIVNTFTRDCGRIDLMLKGSRNISAKSFPSAELFRVFSLEFIQKTSSGNNSDIFSPKVMEYSGNFDRIALYTQNYLSRCEYASFLLKHTAPFLVLPETFDSLLVLLERLTDNGDHSFDITSSKLVFLDESGLLPEDAGKSVENNALLQQILAYARNGGMEKPLMTPQYEKRLTEWVKALCRYHGLGSFTCSKE